MEVDKVKVKEQYEIQVKEYKELKDQWNAINFRYAALISSTVNLRTKKQRVICEGLGVRVPLNFNAVYEKARVKLYREMKALEPDIKVIEVALRVMKRFI